MDMKTALLHYWLTNMRGGEKVLAELCRLFPDAHVYTHACIPSQISPDITAHPIHESLISRLPFGRSACRRYLPLMPYAAKKFDFQDCNLLISSESGPIKGVKKPAGACHVCYCHTPMRYLWDLHDFYYDKAGVVGKLAMRLFTGSLRRADLESAEEVDCFIANSRFVAERIKRVYGRPSTVIHPPVDTEYFGAVPRRNEDYYLYAGSLNAYKRPDLAIEACLKLGRKLVVVGEGAEKEALEKLAGGSALIRLIGRCPDEELRNWYTGARALLFPGVEDFGIIPVEAQAAGLPVIALGEGGALETVEHGRTGLLFNEESIAGLTGAMEEFESRSWEPETCRRHAARFAPERFRSEFRSFLAAKGFPIPEAAAE